MCGNVRVHGVMAFAQFAFHAQVSPTGSAVLTAPNVYGAIRGMETFSQLIRSQDGNVRCVKCGSLIVALFVVLTHPSRRLHLLTPFSIVNRCTFRFALGVTNSMRSLRRRLLTRRALVSAAFWSTPRAISCL